MSRIESIRSPLTSIFQKLQPNLKYFYSNILHISVKNTDLIMPEEIETIEKFNEIIKGDQLTVVHFAANWVEQCEQVDQVLDALGQQSDYATVKFYKCEAENLSEASLTNKIEAAPTVILFVCGKAVDRIDGVNPTQITAKIKQHLNKSGEFKSSQPNQVSLDERLKNLVNKAKIMLFMKGDRVAPRCGFSKQIIAILNDLGVEYETFDILSNEEVRQGLKVYSDWPTYPQLYVKGELIGGLDIVKEMQAAGELLSTLNQ